MAPRLTDVSATATEPAPPHNAITAINGQCSLWNVSRLASRFAVDALFGLSIGISLLLVRIALRSAVAWLAATAKARHCEHNDGSNLPQFTRHAYVDAHPSS